MTEQKGGTAVDVMCEQVARARMSERRGEARELRRGRNVVVARRLSRRAERAARQAGLALARF